MSVVTVILVFILLGVGAGGAFAAMHYLGWPERALPPKSEPDPEAIPRSATIVEVEVERIRGDLRAWLSDQQNTLTQVDAHRDADLAELVTRGMNDLRRDLAARSHSEMAELIDRGGITLQRELEHWLAGELAQLRSEMHMIAADGDPQRHQLKQRRAEVLTELYRRLAKLEWAIVAVTHPIQLPGEPYRIPEQLAPDALKWENWKDVGELAFGFADYFNQHQVLLPAPLTSDVTSFILNLRSTLTGAVYPNLQPRPTPEQLADLRQGLTALGAAMNQTRKCLDAELRQITGEADSVEQPIEAHLGLKSQAR